MASIYATDTYADGPAAAFGTATPDVHDLSLYGSFITDWVAAEEDDLYYARLPFPEAQAIFALGAVEHVRRRTELGWHGTALDDETGSVVIAREDGPFIDLLGKRVRLTSFGGVAPTQVYAFCHLTFDVLEDLSVPRRLYLALGLLHLEDIPVTVEVMNPGG